MRKRFISVLLSPAAVLIFLLAVSSCSGILSPSEADSTASSQASREQGLSLRGSFSFANATAAPSAYLTAAESTQQGSRNALPNLTGISYSVKARRSDGTEREATTVDQAALTYEFSGTLTAGTWEITAYAKQGAITVMQSDPTPITLSKSVPTASASLALKPSTDGDGSINLTISCATDSGIGFIKTECENETKFRATGSDGSKTLTITNTGIPSGIYEVTLSFYTSYAKYNEGAAPLYKCTEYVAVYPELETNKWTPSTAPHIDASGNFTVTKSCVETFVYRKIYVSSSGNDDTANGTSERPFGTIEKAMKRLNEVAVANIITGISESNPWELHVSGEVKKTTNMTTAISFINVDNITGHLAIIGDGSGAALNADNKGRVLYVGTGTTVTMENITLKNGSYGNGNGVCVNDGGTFKMISGSIYNCTPFDNSSGGGIYVYSGGTFTMEGGTISACSTNKNGGGIYSEGSVTIQGGEISGCTANATGEGGGIYSKGTLEISGGSITGNTAGSIGAGVCATGGSVTITTGCSINANTAATNGNNIYISSGVSSATIPAGASDFYDDTTNATGYPDAICLTGTNFARFNKPNTSSNYIDSATRAFSGNATIYLGTTTSTSTDNVWKSDCLKIAKECQYNLTIMPTNPSTSVKATIKNSSSTESTNYLIHFNTAGKTLTLTRLILDGNSKKCGIAKLEAGTLTATNCTFQYGKATYGGGLYVADDTTATLTSCTIDSCRAESNSNASCGGGIFTRGTVNFNGTGTIQSCSVSGMGGGVLVANVTNASFNMSGGTISSCSAEISTATDQPTGWGGGVFSYKTFDMSGGTITGCTAQTDGAGVAIIVASGSTASNNVFKMSGNASVATNNEVYLDTSGTVIQGKSICQITITGDLNASVAAKIKPKEYTKTIASWYKVLTDDSSDSLVSANYTKFRLVDSDNYMITDEGEIRRGIQVSSNEELSNAITRIKNLSNGESLIINLMNNVNTETTADDNYFIKVPSGANVVIKASSTTTLNYSSSSDAIKLFYVSPSASLTLTNINLTGYTWWGAGPVYGTLKINAGTKINNLNATGGGSCITVHNGGSLNMNGGEISNSEWNGEHGCIEIKSGGNFSMTGGTISSNKYHYNSTGNFSWTSQRYFASVYVSSGASFSMTGGTISGTKFKDNQVQGTDVNSVENYCYDVYAASGSTYTKTGGTISRLQNDS